MQFRRIYWVTELIDAEGHSAVGGVYTSIQDLLADGFKWHADLPNHRAKLRISLVKLDSAGLPLGSWCSPTFDGLAEDLQAYIRTDEFNILDVEALVAESKRFGSA